MRLPACLVLCALAVPYGAAADSMRCGKWVLNETSSVAELLEKCGAPADKTSTIEDVLAINAAGVPYKTGTTTREQWFYQRSAQSLRMVVTIVDGVIKTIERAE
jgi:Protein of unknown function (DUF2845)